MIFVVLRRRILLFGGREPGGVEVVRGVRWKVPIMTLLNDGDGADVNVANNKDF